MTMNIFQHIARPPVQLTVIDPQVSAYEVLATGLRPGSALLILNSQQDGLSQISQALMHYAQNGQEIGALHILSHGRAGAIQLGAGWVNQAELHQHQAELKTWFAQRQSVPEILLYGCSVAAGERGEAFVQQLSQLTGATVAASATPTGNPGQGGNWQLEVTTGAITSPLAFSAAAREAFPGTLPDDNYEQNDSRQTAYDLTALENEFLNSSNGDGLGILNSGEEDWYKFFVSDNSDNLTLDLQFTHANGDLELELYDPEGLRIVSRTSSSNNESITYTPTTGGVYFARVFGANSFNRIVNGSNSYNLIWDDNGTNFRDAYEGNTSRSNAFNLTSSSTYEGRKISASTGHGYINSGEEDWFRILNSPGVDLLTAKLEFDNADGNLDFQIYNSGGQLLQTSSDSTNDADSINQENLALLNPSSGDYFLRVYGRDSSVENSYDLFWDDYANSDPFDGNDSRANAIDITALEDGNVGGVISGSNQSDWYRFVAASDTTVEVDLDFSDNEGDLDLQIYDANGTLIEGSTSITDDESVSAGTTTGGVYFVRVYGQGSTDNAYTLRWDDTGNIDNSSKGYESNNSRYDAYDLSSQAGRLLSSIDGLAMASSSDTDWYKINAAPNASNISANLTFSDANGDLNLRLYNANGIEVASSTSTTNNEAISYSPTSGGTYYLKVDGTEDVLNSYDLQWNQQAQSQGSSNPDFTGDGRPDILWRDYNTGLNYRWEMNGSSIVSGANFAPLSGNWRMAAASDFDSDNKADIFWRNQSTGENVIWKMDGLTITGATPIQQLGLEWELATTGDFNNDGQEDLIWRHRTAGANVVWYLGNNGQIVGSKAFQSLSNNWSLETSGDFNDDGNEDLVWRNYADGTNAYWYTDGNMNLIGGETFAQLIDRNWHIEGSADMNQDGKADLLLRNYSDGTNVIWNMNGTQIIGGGAFSTLAGSNWQMVV